MLSGERGLGGLERERVGPFAAAEEQGEGGGLGVGVGELFVRSLGEKQVPPVLGEPDERRVRILERVLYVVTKHSAQRGQKLGESFEIDLACFGEGDDWLPQEKILQYSFKRFRILRCGGFSSVGGNIA